MIINPLSSATSSGFLPTSTSTNATTSTTSSSTDPAQSTDSMFLQLLTAQLENQSPLDPVDPTEFTSQLVQFNMLDELTQINQTLQYIAGAAPTTTGSAPSSSAIQGAN